MVCLLNLASFAGITVLKTGEGMGKELFLFLSSICSSQSPHGQCNLTKAVAS